MSEPAVAHDQGPDSAPGDVEPVLVARIAAHPRRLVVPLLASVVTVAIVVGAQVGERADRDAADWSATARAETVELDLRVERAVAGRAGSVEAVRRWRGSAIDAPPPPTPWLGATDPAPAGAVAERLAVLRERIAGDRERLAQATDATAGLDDDVHSLGRAVSGIVLALDELLARLARRDRSSDQMLAAAREITLVQRLAVLAGRLVKGGDGALGSIDRLGRDLVAFGEINNALLHGSRDLGVKRVEDDAARTLLEDVGREFRTMVGLVEPLVSGASAIATRDRSAARIRDRLRRARALLEVETADRRTRAALRPALGTAPRALVAMTLLAWCTFAVRLWRDGQAARVAHRRRVEAAQRQREIDVARDVEVRASHRRLGALHRTVDAGLDALREGVLDHRAATPGEADEALVVALDQAAEALRTRVAAVQGLAVEVDRDADENSGRTALLRDRMDEQSAHLESAIAAARDASRRSEELVAEGERLDGLSRECAGSLRDASAAIQGAFGDLEALVSAVNETATHVRHLAATSAQVRDLVASLETLGEQSKMLSLNVAIQSSMETEGGRALAGFADEVQRLAERSRQIGRRVQGLDETIREAGERANDAIKRGVWSATSTLERANRAQAPLTTIERTAGRLESASVAVGDASRGQAATIASLRTAQSDLRTVLSGVRDHLRTHGDRCARLARGAGDLATRLAAFSTRAPEPPRVITLPAPPGEARTGTLTDALAGGGIDAPPDEHAGKPGAG